MIFAYEKMKSSKYIPIIIKAISNIDSLAQSNFALRSIIVECFTKNFAFKTNHICFHFYEENNELKVDNIVLEDKEHNCKCCFMQNMIRVWNKSFDTHISIDKILINFLKSYKFKFIYGYSYISLYDTVVKNNSEKLKSFSVQIITIEDIAIKITNCDSFIKGLFDKLFFLFQDFDVSDKNELDKFSIISIEFFHEIIHLTKEKSSKILVKNVYLFKRLIDILEVIYNENSLEIKTSFQHNAFIYEILIVEIYILKTFSMMTSIFDFNDKNKANEIIFYIINKILDNSNELYSFHNTLNRALSIFINRYAHFLCKIEKNDLLSSLQIILRDYLLINQSRASDLKDLASKLLKNTYKVIGFINSIYTKHWVYYGETFVNMYYLYYSEDYYELFYLADYTLVKLLITFTEDSTIDIIRMLENLDCLKIYSSSINLIDNMKIPIFKDKEEKLLLRNFETIIHILVNNSFVIDLLFNSNEELINNKIKDVLLEIYKSEHKTSILELITEKLVHLIISKENKIVYSEIKSKFSSWINHNFEGELESIAFKICDQVKSKNNPIFFKIRKEDLNRLDIFYYEDETKRSKAEKYLLEFHKNDFIITNSADLKSFEFHDNLVVTLNRNVFKPILLSRIFRFLEFYMKNNNYLFNLVVIKIKFLSLFLNFISRKKELISNETFEYLKEFRNIANETLNKVMNKDDNFKTTIKQILDDYQKIINSESNNLQTQKIVEDTSKLEMNIKKQKILEMKEKLKNQFRTKSEKFLKDQNENLILTDTQDTYKDSSNCCFCHQEINPKIKKPYGQIGNITKNNLLFHAKMQTLYYSFNNIILPNVKNVEGSKNESNIHIDSNIVMNKKKIKNNMEMEEVIDNTKYEIKPNLNNNFDSKFDCKSNNCPQEDIVIDIDNKMEIDKNYLIEENSKKFLKNLTDKFTESKKKELKSFRITSCNHYIHFDCYSELLFKYSKFKKNSTLLIDFSCPLCNNFSNVFIPITVEENLCKFETFNEQNIEFYDKNEISSRHLLIHNIHFIESLITKTIKKQFLMTDFDKNSKTNYEILKKIFIYNYQFFDIISLDDFIKNFEIMKNLVFSLKVLLKFKKIDLNIFLERYKELLNFQKICTDSVEILFNDEINNFFFEMIFLFFILFDSSNINQINCLLGRILPYLVFQLYIRNAFSKYEFKLTKQEQGHNFFKISDLENFISIEEKNIKRSLLCYFRKIIVLPLIMGRLETNFKNDQIVKIKYNMSFSELEDEFDLYSGTYFNDKKLLQTICLNNYNLFKELDKVCIAFVDNKLVSINSIMIDPSLLLITPDIYFSFINLPKNLLELNQKYIRKICKNCDTAPPFAVICLVCGQKVCYMNNCCNNLGKNSKQFEYIHHAKKCCYGTCCFITLYNGKIIYVKENDTILSDVCPYRNKFGEGITSKNITDEYILNEAEYNLILNDFINSRHFKYFKKESNYGLNRFNLLRDFAEI